ncbi:unnamed protein product [Menidia menidia]|uniref:(Atlantic silverside) hypothetical protein n=1 Tax=Menidia menidia TaxID=238744 RepID=A0A8S4AQ98_9TELE|nr:unnamed protein product [Menidia menidia]
MCLTSCDMQLNIYRKHRGGIPKLGKRFIFAVNMMVTIRCWAADVLLLNSSELPPPNGSDLLTGGCIKTREGLSCRTFWFIMDRTVLLFLLAVQVFLIITALRSADAAALPADEHQQQLQTLHPEKVQVQRMRITADKQRLPHCAFFIGGCSLVGKVDFDGNLKPKPTKAKPLREIKR